MKRWKISDKLELVGHLGDISHGNCEEETAGEKKCSCSLGKGSGLNDEEMINRGTPGFPISMVTAGCWAEWPPGWNWTHSMNRVTLQGVWLTGRTFAGVKFS